MKRGIAPKMANAFNCDNADLWTLEAKKFEGDMRKLGNAQTTDAVYSRGVSVYNLYTQYHWAHPSRFGIPLDYDALRLAVRKMFLSCSVNELDHVGLPKIGCGLAGGDEKIVFDILSEEHRKYANTFDLTIVEYDG
jgi:O-acetyl-ADP-ribose deacetylase (regulator of RNase III)